MNELKKEMVEKAKHLYRNRISPCSTRRTFNDCFTVEDGKLYFWFNTEDNSTHILAADLV